MPFTIHKTNEEKTRIIVCEKDIKKNHLLGSFMITGLPTLQQAIPRYPFIHVCINVDILNEVKVSTNVTFKCFPIYGAFPMKVRMSNFDGGNGL